MAKAGLAPGFCHPQRVYHLPTMQMTIDIPDEQVAALDELSAQRHASRAVIVSDALEAYLQAASGEVMAAITPSPITDPEERRRHFLSFFGALPDIGDGLAFQERLRNEWVREWDAEYDPKVHG